MSFIGQKYYFWTNEKIPIFWPTSDQQNKVVRNVQKRKVEDEQTTQTMKMNPIHGNENHEWESKQHMKRPTHMNRPNFNDNRSAS